MIWIALAIFIVGILIYTEFQRHNLRVEEQKRKEEEEKLKLEEEKLHSNPEYTKRKSLEHEMSDNRTTYLINQRDQYEMEIEILNTKDQKKIQEIKEKLGDINKSQKILNKEYTKMLDGYRESYGSLKRIDWPEDLQEEIRDLRMELFKKKRELHN